MNQDIYHSLQTKTAMTAATVTGSGTGTIIDTQGFECGMFVLLPSTITADADTNYLTLDIEESDSSSFADSGVAMSSTEEGKRRLQTPGSGTAYTAVRVAATATTPVCIGFKVGILRYVRLKWTETGTYSAVSAAVCVLGGARSEPVAGR